MPSLLGDGDKGIKILYGEGTTANYGSQGRKNLLYWDDKPNEPTKKGPLSFVLFESPFTSVLTVSRSHLSLVSLVNASIVLPIFKGGWFL